MERIRAKGVNIVIYDPSFKRQIRFENSKVIRDFDEFCNMSDVIVANRMDNMLSDVKKRCIQETFISETDWKDRIWIHITFCGKNSDSI